MDKIMNNPKNVRFKEIITLIEHYGFVYNRTEGSHKIYQNEEWKCTVNIQEVNGHAKPYQVRQIIDEFRENGIV